jgi:hypothetical protein
LEAPGIDPEEYRMVGEEGWMGREAVAGVSYKTSAPLDALREMGVRVS